MQVQFLPGAGIFMKKSALRCIGAVILALGVLSLAHADAVYLKNGKVMQGRIVEKNEQFLILKMGEDENATRATIFLEDINRIETEEEYFQKVKLIPEPFPTEDFKQPVVIQPGLPLYEKEHKEVNGTEYIKTLIEENRRVSPTGSQASQPISYQPRGKSGSISGFVKLPELIKTKKGDLYVFLMQDIGGGRFSSAAHMLYQKIDKDHINSTLMYYEIKDVPPGVYKVFAQWDIEPPAIEVNSAESYYTNLSGIGLKGDYSGSLSGEVSLAAEEAKANVNFDCLRLIATDQFVPGKGQRPDFEILDLYYRKLSFKDVLFIMVVKNKGDSSIMNLSFDILVNDQKVFRNPIKLGSIGPKEEKEFNITPVYTAYLNKSQEDSSGPKESVKVLKFTVIWSVSGEVEFEKALFLL